MLFNNVFCVCFLALLAPKIETNAQLNSNTEKPEALFADVIKNISRVNNELQDLINNYEQLKKTQDSAETLDDSESDADGSRVNRNSKNSVGNKGDTSGKTSTTLKYQTKMIYVEKYAEKSSEPEMSIESEKSTESEKSITSEKSIESGKSTESEKNSQSQLSNEVEKSREVEPRKPMEKTDKNKIKVQKTTTHASIVNEEPIAPKEKKKETKPENQEFVNIHKEIKIKPDRKKRIIPEAAVQETSKQTKYSEKESQTKYLRDNSSESDSSVDIETLKEHEEVGVNKPKERAYENDNDVTKFTAALYLRSEKKGTTGSTTTKKVDDSLSLEFTDDDEALSKDLLKTSVLRQAYGDACLKFVIRKCYRACRSAYKFSCQAFKCKSEWKKYFDKSSRTGCIDAYNASSKEDDAHSLRGIVDPNPSNAGIIMREGYISMACQTQIEKPTRRMSNVTSTKNGEQLNILRDVYEKACRKISQKKCGTACQFAQTATCDKFTCAKRFKKNLKRNCRSQCKQAYSNKAPKSSDSDDDSDADSDDKSDDSDDDDDDGDNNGDSDDDES